MEGLIGLGVVVGTIIVGYLLGWIISGLYNIYSKYHTKKNHKNHPEFSELIKKRNTLSEEYNGWWHLKYDAKKWIDAYREELQYTGIINEEGLQKHQADYNQANEKLLQIGDKLEEARNAVDNYREKYNIRHW